VRLWANSLQASGFSGDAFVVLYGENPDVESRLIERNIGVYKPEKDHLGLGDINPLVHRFYHKWVILNDLGFDDLGWVISTDIRDVVFQSDPISWINENLGNEKFFITSEGMAYEDEFWNRDNFKACFGESIWSTGIASRTIYNCGVVGGAGSYAAEMFLMLYLLGYGHPGHRTGEWTDQAALNLVSRFKLFGEHIRFVSSEEGLAAQLGTFLDEALCYDRFLGEPKPVIQNGEVYTAGGVKFAMVHQYDRIPELVESYSRSYGD
jgi:hypothetical protein